MLNFNTFENTQNIISTGVWMNKEESVLSSILPIGFWLILILCILTIMINIWKIRTNSRKENIRQGLLSLFFACNMLYQWNTGIKSREENILMVWIIFALSMIILISAAIYLIHGIFLKAKTNKK